MITIKVPDFLADDPGWVAFYNKIQSNYAYYRTKILNLRHLYNASQTDLPSELASVVGAYISPNDNSDIVRRKSQSAIHLHKNLSFFKNSWKPYIDSIFGQNSQIYTGTILARPFTVGRSFIGEIDKLGTIWSGINTPVSIAKGQVYIDVGSTINSSQIQLLRNYFTPLRPMYFDVYFGYAHTVSSNAFAIGSSLIGGSDTIGGTSPVMNFDIYLKL